jgi:hypothetical protein
LERNPRPPEATQTASSSREKKEEEEESHGNYIYLENNKNWIM